MLKITDQHGSSRRRRRSRSPSRNRKYSRDDDARSSRHHSRERSRFKKHSPPQFAGGHRNRAGRSHVIRESSNDNWRRSDSSRTRDEHYRRQYERERVSSKKSFHMTMSDKAEDKCNKSSFRLYRRQQTIREYSHRRSCDKSVDDDVAHYHTHCYQKRSINNHGKGSPEGTLGRFQVREIDDKPPEVLNEQRDSVDLKKASKERNEVKMYSSFLVSNNEGLTAKKSHPRRYKRSSQKRSHSFTCMRDDHNHNRKDTLHTHTLTSRKRPGSDIMTVTRGKARHPKLSCLQSLSLSTPLTGSTESTGFGPLDNIPCSLALSLNDSNASTTNAAFTPKKKVCLEEELIDVIDQTNSNESDELNWVAKWMRSVPDELYYTRGAKGSSTATERAKALCVKFEELLLTKATLAREEAEKLGREKAMELKIKNAQVLTESKKLRRKSEKGDKVRCCCDNSCKQHFTSGPFHSSTVIPASKVQSVKSVSLLPTVTTVTPTEENFNDNVERLNQDKRDDSLLSAQATPLLPCHVKARKDQGDVCSSCSGGCTKENVGSGAVSKNDESCSILTTNTSPRFNGFGFVEMKMKKQHPRRLHSELWHNDPGSLNHGPVCRCSPKARRSGVRHGVYPGEQRPPRCDPFCNNIDRLFHYRVTIGPPENFLISTPSVINYDGHEYIFEGFSLFSHHRFNMSWPSCKVVRFNIQYDVFVEEVKFPESFCVQELVLFEKYLFREILELVDLAKTRDEGIEPDRCSHFHLMPRFLRQLPENGQEILSMSRVLMHLLNASKPVVREEDLQTLFTVKQSEWQNFADRHKGTVVTRWGMKPCALRVDQIDRDVSDQDGVNQTGIPFPLLVHFGSRPPQLSYAGNGGYQRAWNRYVKYRHLLANMPKPLPEDKQKSFQMNLELQMWRQEAHLKKDVSIAIPSKGFETTGISCDVVQHALLIPVLEAHLRFHGCLEALESKLEYKFQNRHYLQLALTHPSYRENFGTNPDHARNALNNCGIRHPKLGQMQTSKKRGINTLIHIMAKFGADQETESGIVHNERLEFLGDAVIEFLTTVHLFHIFPDLEEGGLATYRAALVQNQHLTFLAQGLRLQDYLLYAHSSDLCHRLELNHALANCFEALIGALYLDGGIEAADGVLGRCLYGTDPPVHHTWKNYPKHPLQREEPNGDRHWVQTNMVLQKLVQLEKRIGVDFKHIRLLARAFTDRSLDYNNLTKGSNQRLEFLGDSVLQLVVTDYLYRHFPEHHEGHLSLLRSSLVSNRSLSEVCQELGLPQYSLRAETANPELSIKDKGDLFEALFGAIYLDKGLKICECLCRVCIFPRLSTAITTQAWNDPKSKLQQCCLTLRTLDTSQSEAEPDIPVYKVIQTMGASNSRTFIVAVYFRGERLATGKGSTIQEAEMTAAAAAMQHNLHLFPQLKHQKRVVRQTVVTRNRSTVDDDSEKYLKDDEKLLK